MRLWQELAGLRAAHRAVRWSEPDKLHLTLVFVGPSEPQIVPQLGRALAEVAARWQPFEVVTAESGGHLGRRGGVAWLTVGAGRREVSQLSRELDEAMGSGVYVRSQPRPHLTVARGVDSALLDELATSPLRFAVESIELLRSHTGPGGAHYESLARFRLAEEPA